MKIPPALKDYLTRGQTLWAGLSQREKVGIAASVVVLLLMALNFGLYEPISRAFDRQSRQLAALERDWSQVNQNLDQYVKLQQRLRAVQEEYRKAEFKDGVRSHLERILQSKLSLQAGRYQIRPNPVRKLGGSYALTPFTLKFDTQNFSGLVALLEELTQGPQALILSKLEITKSRRGDQLAVTIDIGNIEHDRSNAG